MNVDVLQLHLSNLSQLLRNAGANATANSMDNVCQALQPYRERRFEDLLKIVERAEAEPPVRKATTSRAKTKPDAEAIREMSDAVHSIWEHAAVPEITVDRIEGEVQRLRETGLPTAELQKIAKRIGITQKLKASEWIPQIRQVIMERKGANARVGV